jgi:hypothetical protein
MEDLMIESKIGLLTQSPIKVKAKNRIKIKLILTWSLWNGLIFNLYCRTNKLQRLTEIITSMVLIAPPIMPNFVMKM